MAGIQLWYDKYRPKTLDEYVWADERLRLLVTEWIEHKRLPSIMLAGGPGRGKTVLADLIVSGLGIDEPDVLRLQGAKHNNADTIRNRVQEFCELGGWSGMRIVLFDEADLLSRTAQEMLRNVIDEYSGSVRFIFTCNYPHRLIEALASSRLYRVDIERLPTDEFFERMCKIVMDEGIELDDATVDTILGIRDLCYPDLRRAINVLQASVTDGKITRVRDLKSATGMWESYFTEILTHRADPIAEICRVRDVLIGLTPDEMEDVYRFLYHHGPALFGEKQITALYVINEGQKVHRSALLPDMILLEVIVRLLHLFKHE